MKWLVSILVAGLALTLTLVRVGSPPAARAQEPEGAGQQSGGDADEGEQAAKLFRKAQRIDDVSWIAGRWKGSALGGTVEEHWMELDGRSMTGMFRLVQREAAGFHQFMLLEETNGRTWLRMQHVNPGFVVWEKAGPLVFELVEADGQRAVFESPDPKQIPSRMTYQAVSTKGLSLKIESTSALGGPSGFEALYERATP